MYGPSTRFYIDGRLVGEAADYTDLDAVWRVASPGSLEVETPGLLDWHTALTDPTHTFVTVVVDGLVPWTGIVDEVEIESTPDGYVTRLSATGARAVLDRLRVYPNNTGRLSDQGGEEKLTRTGPAAAIVRDLIVECAARQGVPVHVAALEDVESSQPVTVTAAMDPLGEVATKALRGTGWELSAMVWHPGLDTPPVAGVAPGDVVVTLAPAELNPRVQWREEDGGKAAATVRHALGGVLVVASDAEDTDEEAESEDRGRSRTVYTARTDPVVAAGLGRWAGLQGYTTDEDTEDEWASLTGGTGIELETVDGEPYVYGRDYRVGDIVTGRVAGVEARAQVTEVALSVKPDGVTISPKLGTPKADGFTSLVSLVARLYRDKEKR